VNSDFVCNTLLSDFYDDKLRRDGEFAPTPSVTVVEVGKCISSMENNNSMGLDGISPFLLKLALPNVVHALTYVYKVILCE